MIHSIYNSENDTEISIDDGFKDFITINIYDKIQSNNISFILDKKHLRDFIGILLHIQSKMRK